MQQTRSPLIPLVLALALTAGCAARTTTGLSQAGVGTTQTVQRAETLFDEAYAAGAIAESDYAEALSVLDDAYESIEAGALALQAGHMAEWQTQMDALLVMVDQLAEITSRNPATQQYTALAVEAFRLAIFSFGLSR